MSGRHRWTPTEFQAKTWKRCLRVRPGRADILLQPKCVSELVSHGDSLNVPCLYLENLVAKKVFKPLLNRSGLNCRIMAMSSSGSEFGS
jgi:hypothetical protein